MPIFPVPFETDSPEQNAPETKVPYEGALLSLFDPGESQH